MEQPRSVIPPLSVVKIIKVTEREPDWPHHLGRSFRIGYYSRQDGLDCVWLVDDEGKYCETVDQAMIQSHFEVITVSDETDLFGVNRPLIQPIR